MDGMGVEELGKESALRMSDAEAAMISHKGLDRAKARRSFQKRKAMAAIFNVQRFSFKHVE